MYSFDSVLLAVREKADRYSGLGSDLRHFGINWAVHGLAEQPSLFPFQPYPWPANFTDIITK